MMQPNEDTNLSSNSNPYNTISKTGSSGNTVSTGVKGLSEEQLKNAKPNPEEARRLGNYKDTEADARSFARQGKLVAQKVDYLPADNGGNP